MYVGIMVSAHSPLTLQSDSCYSVINSVFYPMLCVSHQYSTEIQDLASKVKIHITSLNSGIIGEFSNVCI